MSEETKAPNCDSSTCGADFLGGLFNLMDKIEANKESETEKDDSSEK